MTTYNDAVDGHTYRPGYNPEFLRRVKERQRIERLAAQKAEQAKARQEREEAKEREAAEHVEREQARKQAQEFRATEAYRIIVVSEAGEGKQSARSIIDRVSAAYGVSYGEIVGHRRSRHIIKARHAAIKAVVEARPDMTLPMVGRVFNKDHTTIMSALGRKKRSDAKDPR